MKVFAYCAASFQNSTRRAAGVAPVTCPPVLCNTFDIVQLAGNDLIYFDLHGWPNAPMWTGDFGMIALRDTDIARADLRGAVIFAANCYLGDDENPMLDALLAAGARYVIAGAGPNYAAQNRPQWAAKLGLWVRRLMAFGFDPLQALSIGKIRVSLGDKSQAAKDTLNFRAYYREGDNEILHAV